MDLVLSPNYSRNRALVSLQAQLEQQEAHHARQLEAQAATIAQLKIQLAKQAQDNLDLTKRCKQQELQLEAAQVALEREGSSVARPLMTACEQHIQETEIVIASREAVDHTDAVAEIPPPPTNPDRSVCPSQSQDKVDLSSAHTSSSASLTSEIDSQPIQPLTPSSNVPVLQSMRETDSNIDLGTSTSTNAATPAVEFLGDMGSSSKPGASGSAPKQEENEDSPVHPIQ